MAKAWGTLERGIEGFVVLVACFVMLPPAVAQETESLNVDVGKCVELTKPDERLACFEAQVDRARTDDTRQGAIGNEQPPAGVAVAPVAAAETPSAAQPETRGLAKRERRSREDLPPDIVAKVSALRETVPNSYVITLDNGEVWRQMRPMAYALRPGTEVRIYATRWGEALRLTAPSLRGYIQVERVR